MLAILQGTPRNRAEWSIWSLANYDALTQIRQAVEAQKGIILPEYQVEPISWDDLDTWLSNNQSAHSDFTGALGQQSSDLLHVDFEDPNQLVSWVWLNYQELFQACATLKIGP